jgi:uncharacterized protein (TIGR02466 family)
MLEEEIRLLIKDIADKKDGRLSPIFNINIYEKDIVLNNELRIKYEQFIKEQIFTHLQNNSDSNFTGDIKGMGSIHNESTFQYLIQEIEKAVSEYLKSFSKLTQKLQIYYQKSWPVILKRGGMVGSHHHANAHLSAVYYLNVPKGEGGDLIFYSPIDLNLPSLSTGVDFFHAKTYIHAIKPYSGLLVIFPSVLKHEVTKYEGHEPRLSLSFDFVLTASEEAGSGEIENLAPSINLWRPFEKNEE